MVCFQRLQHFEIIPFFARLNYYFISKIQIKEIKGKFPKRFKQIFKNLASYFQKVN